MMFTIIKSIHVTAVILTISMFLIRMVWMLQGSKLLHHPWVRVVPHVNDTILFFSALGTAIMLGQYPFVNDWLTAKVFALLAYIILGSIALKSGQQRGLAMVAFTGALISFGYILLVARCNDPLACFGVSS